MLRNSRTEEREKRKSRCCFRHPENMSGKKERRRVKQQSNFYTLQNAIKEFPFPITVQMIPSVQNKIFDQYQRQVFTFVGSCTTDKISCVTRDGKKSSLSISDNSMFYTLIENEYTYHDFGEIYRNRVKHDIEWIVVLKRFTYKDDVFEVGDTLGVNSVQHNNPFRMKRCLRVTLHPSMETRNIPGNIRGEFKKCRNPYCSSYTKLSDVVDNGMLPCLARHAKNENKASNDQMLLLETFSSEIFIACKNSNGKYQIHTFPSHQPIDVEILDGEPPVDVITPEELCLIKEQMIFNNLPRADAEHDMCFYDTLRLKRGNQTKYDSNLYEYDFLLSTKPLNSKSITQYTKAFLQNCDDTVDYKDVDEYMIMKQKSEGLTSSNKDSEVNSVLPNTQPLEADCENISRNQYYYNILEIDDNVKYDHPRVAKTRTKFDSDDYDYTVASDDEEIQPKESLTQQISLSKIESLTNNEVLNLLKKMSLNHHIEYFHSKKINGELLANFSESNLTALNLTDFEARKLYKYINGWRPIRNSNGKKQTPIYFSDMSIEDLSEFLNSLKMNSLARFTVEQEIDGELMQDLLNDDILLTIKCDHGIMIENEQLFQLKLAKYKHDHVVTKVN